MVDLLFPGEPRLLREVEVPGRADGVDLTVVRVPSPDVLRDRREDVDRARGVRKSSSELPVVHTQQPIALREPIRGVQLPRERERVLRQGPGPQAAMRPLPRPGRADVEPSSQGIAEVDEAIAPVNRDVDDLLERTSTYNLPGRWPWEESQRAAHPHSQGWQRARCGSGPFGRSGRAAFRSPQTRTICGRWPKWRSRSCNVMLCCNTSAEIQMSLVGIGVPWSRSWRKTLA